MHAALTSHLLPRIYKCFNADKVPINNGQRAAVEGLQGGLSIIHGPPGTGKSTTILHIVESKVQPEAKVRMRW